MAISLKPISVSADRLSRLSKAAASQNPTASQFAKSNDEENWPVFRTPSKGRKLIYLANHTTMDDEGKLSFLYDMAFVHYVRDNGRFATPYRCNMGLDSEVDPAFDGTCPLCEANNAGFDWYNARVMNYQLLTKDIIVNVDTPEARDRRGSFLKQRPVEGVQKRHILPVAVFDLPDRGVVPVKNSEGKIVPENFWMALSDNQFSKIVSSLNATNLETPAGQFFVFDYSYDTKGKEPNAQDAARNLTVTLVQEKPFSSEIVDKIEGSLDEWTPEKSIEMVRESSFYPSEQLREMSDQLMASLIAKTKVLEEENARLMEGAPAASGNASAAVSGGASDEAIQNILESAGVENIGRSTGDIEVGIGQDVEIEM